MIQIYLSKMDSADGKEIVLQHISNPKKLADVKEILNHVRALSFGEKIFYKWQPKLEEFDGKKVVKISINGKNDHEIEKIEKFNHKNEVKPLEVLLSEGVARDKKVVVFQWISDPLRLRDSAIREKINSIRAEKFPGREMVKQPNVENFEFKPVIKIKFKDEDTRIEYIAKFHQKPADGIYRAPKVRYNLGSGSGQASLFASTLGDLIENKEEFYDKILRKISK